PAAKLRPVSPITTTRPPVMYSQPWSPTPSTTVSAPELRTAKRSPAMPRKYAARDERAEALARRAGEVHADRVGRQPARAVADRDLGAEDGADRPVDVADG